MGEAPGTEDFRKNELLNALGKKHHQADEKPHQN